jgi:tetratricopeptide (TPR) repeat protein
MADYQQYLAILEVEPSNAQALTALESLANATNGALTDAAAARAFDDARKTHRDRGEIELVARLFEIELSAAKDQGRRADLLLEKGRLYADEFLDEDQAQKCFERVLELRPDDSDAQEVLAQMGLVRENWERIVKKYLDEARAATDRQLGTSMYLSAARTTARYKPGSAEVEEYLRKALEVDVKNRAAAVLLERILRASGRWEDVARLLEQRVDAAATKEERVQALLSYADLARTRLNKPNAALDAFKKVLSVEPSHPRAMKELIDAYAAEENWVGLAKIYEGALKVRQKTPDAELGLALQVAMIHWKRLRNMDSAEESFRRIRKVEPAHPVMLDFYREYHKERAEGQKLLQVLQAAQKAETDPQKRSALSIEMAGLAETEVGNPEKAIDSWKAILRQDPKNAEGRIALKRLYQRTEKWNALLELLKEEVEQLSPATEEGKQARIERLLEVVAIYRDRLNLDVMVINTFNTVLGLAPDHAGALDALAAKYEQLGRWNDLTAVLQKKAQAAATPKDEKVSLLRRIASLWADRSGNHAQAIKPLEDLLALAPDDREASAKLKDIYARRRQWRALIELMNRELPTLADERKRNQLAEMASLASDKLGDARASISIWNRVLEEDPQDALALASLASLYEKEKRWPALAEVYHRQRDVVGASDARAAVAVLERLGTLYAEKLEGPQQAAAAFDEVLRLQPGHTKALRVLRELYAQAGDLDALERLYGGLGAWEELIEVWSAVAERSESEKKLAILQRAAKIAEERVGTPERVARAYERILAVDPHNPTAARALVPIYRKGEKWARLLSTYEILLGHAAEKTEKLTLHREIRQLCEEKIGSKAMAFQWAAAAYELAPDDEGLLRDLQRLGAEADAWERVAEILQKRVDDETLPAGERLRLARELGRMLAAKLHKPDLARVAWEKVLLGAPDDPEAMSALEDLATQQSRWPDLLVIFRRRAELEQDKGKKLDLLFKIAFIEEERVVDLEAASRTYDQIVRIDPRSQRALRAFSKVQGARGDAEGLARALELELTHADEIDQKVGLLLRLGGLYEERLGKRAEALARFKSAFEIQPGRREVQTALERFLDPAAEEKIDVARLLAPVYERNDDSAKLARAVEILRLAEEGEAARLSYDKRLYHLYNHKLKDPLNAYEVAARILQVTPEDEQNRDALDRLAGELSAYDDLVKHYEKALAAAPGRNVDARVQHALATELAILLDERLTQPVPAEAAWRRVVDLDATDERAYLALEKLLRAGGRWDDLREVLGRHEQNTLDQEARREILLSLCDLYEGVLDDAAGAQEAYRRVLEVDPASMRSYKALERLYERASKWAELEDLLARESDYVDVAERLALTYRRAELRAVRLDARAGAVDLIEDVLSKDPAHANARRLLESLFDDRALKLRVARLLRPRYEADSDWREVVRMLAGEREFAQTPVEIGEILAKIAQLQEERLADENAAFATWLEAMRVDAEDARPRIALRRLAHLLDRWNDASAAWEAALERLPVTDTTLRSQLLAEVASIYDTSMGDVAKATKAYERLLEVDPANLTTSQPAATALERLYDEQESWHELIEILHKQADWADAPERRKAAFQRIAQIQEGKLADIPAAIATWRELLNEDGENAAALDALERLHAGRNEHRDLIEILRRRVELARDPGERRALLWRIAELHEKQLADANDAVAAYNEILDAAPEDQATLAELARIYRSQERWSDLVEISERRLALANASAERSARRFELGELLRDKLARPEEALDRFRQILVEEPDHARARIAVESFLDDPDLKLRAAEILQPIYEGAADHEKLVALYQLEVEAIDDVRERVSRLRKIAALQEGPLASGDAAFEATARAARLAPAEPEFPELLSNLQRLAFERDRVTDLVALYQELAPDVLDAVLQRRMYLDIADLARGKLRDLTLARDYYRRVLDAVPDDARALTALELLYRETSDHQALRDVLRGKAERTDDIDTKYQALTELAVLAEEKLNEGEDAVQAWEQVLELQPADADATHALERLYTMRERWVELAELLEKRLGFAEDLKEAVDLRFRLGELFDKKLMDPDRAVENYEAVLGGDPGHAEAIAALERYLEDAATRLGVAEVLEPLYISRQNWPGLIRITEIRLDAEQDPGNRQQLTRRIARLYEEQLEDLEGAFRWYGKVFREDPEDRQIRDQLQRLAQILGRWAELANIYQEFITDEQNDTPALREVARSLADIADRRLDDIERSRAAFARLLQLEPNDASAFAQLEAMLTRSQRWFALIESYEEAGQVALDPARRIDLLGRIARVHEQRLTAPDKAILAWRDVLEIDLDHQGAINELDRLYQESKRWTDLAELLATRVERAGGPAESAALRVRLAEVLETRLDDTRGAIDQYEQVLQAEPDYTPALVPLERLVAGNEFRQRIAEILEPIYRQKDVWQKLVVILDAQLEFVEDKPRRVEMLREIARIHETRGGALDLALSALARAWKEDVSSEEVYADLERLAAKQQQWEMLVQTIDDGVEGIYDYDLAARLLGRVGDIEEGKRGRRPAAIAAWNRVLEVKEDDPAALDALARLYAAEEMYAPLVKTLERKADVTEDIDETKQLRYRVAELQERALGQRDAAIATWKNVLGFDDADATALDALERLYRETGEHRPLAETLARKIELSEDPVAKRRLQFAAAEVWKGPIGDTFEAISLYKSALDADTTDAEALAALDELYLREKNFSDLVETIDRRAELAEDPAVRADLAHRAARVVETELAEADQAIERYKRILTDVPRHAPTREALEALTADVDTREAAADVLEPVYRADYLWAPLAALYERRLETPGQDPSRRRERFAALAEVHEQGRRDVAAAFSTWARWIREEPDDEPAQGELDRLAQTRGSWPELAQLYETLLEATLDGDQQRRLAMKLAHIYEEALGDLGKAASRYRRALDAGGEEGPALAALDRIYEREGRWAELAEVLQREADGALSSEDQASYLYRLGDVKERPLNDPAGAVAAYRDVLDRVPSHPAGRAALERLLGNPAERQAVIAILEPIFESEADHARLADLLDAKLTVEESASERALILERAAELAEKKLGDKVRALDAVGRWLAEDPASEEAADELLRLAGELDRWEEAAARFTDVLSASRNDDVTRDLSLRLGRILLGSLRDPGRAEPAYRRVLDADAQHLEALAALDQIYRATGDVAQLVGILWTRAEAENDTIKKRGSFAESARLREDSLGDDAGAIAGWKEVLELDDGDHEAHTRLAALYEKGRQWEALVDILELTARHAPGKVDERAARWRAAEVLGGELGNLDRAVDAWTQVADLSPEDDAPLAALESVQRKREDWLAVQEVLVKRIGIAHTPREKLGFYQGLVRLAEHERKSPDEAVGYLMQMLDLDNSDQATYAGLERLYTQTERWHELVELYERHADVRGTLGDAEGEIALLARAADTWEGPLGNADAAGEILEKILKRDPRYVPALARLARIYESAGDWAQCTETLQRALALAPKGKDAADIHYRLGRAAEAQGQSLDEAMPHYQRALQNDPTHAESLAAVEKAARERGDWSLVAQLLERRDATETETAKKLAVAQELATIYKDRLLEPAAALPYLERAAQLAPDDTAVADSLADLYFAAGRHADAEPIYKRLAEKAKAARRAKDVARYQQRIGGLREAAGDVAEALKSYEEAYRVDPSSGATLAGLGRLYMAQKDWDKAQRIYRSMLLQNLDPSVGVSKADVYLQLGNVHVQKAENPKAKSMFERGLETEPTHAALREALAALVASGAK